MIEEKYKGQWIRYVWRECATKAAAVSLLAKELKPLATLPKSVMESLTTLMCSLESGKVSLGLYTIHWRQVGDEFTSDMEYMFE